MGKEYYIKERLLAIGAKFDVYDESGREAFLVEADKFDIGKNINVYTPDKSKKLLYLEQKIRIGAHKYKVYDADNCEIATIEKEFMFPEYHITGTIGNMDMTCNSPLLGRKYEIKKDGVIIGRIGKQWTFGRDRYSLDVIDEQYALFLVGLLVMIDMVRFHSD